MGKFDNIMLCSDLDGTLLKSNLTISEKNIEAIEYFKSEGGIFTFVTGRGTSSSYMAKWAMPNAPSVVYNGAGIFDYRTEKMLWCEYLDDTAKDVVDMVKSKIAELAVLASGEVHYFAEGDNRLIESYYPFINGEEEYVMYERNDEPWRKAIFISEPENVETVKKIIKESEYADRYNYMQSSSRYYEILPKGFDKYSGIVKICEMEGIKNRKIVCVGDNENDVTMIKNADIGVAPKNALDCAKEAADTVLDVTNNEDAIAEVIYNIL